MPVCCCKTPLEKEETLLDVVFPLILRFLPCSHSLPGSVFSGCYCTEAHKTLNYSMHTNKNLLFFSLEMNKNTPTWSLLAGEKHTVPLVFSSSLSQALFCAVRSCCRSAVSIVQLCSPSCQKCNPCLSSCGQRWISGNLGKTCMWEEGKIYRPVLSY